jgi:cell division protein ZapA
MTINVKIADRFYPLKIDKEEEEEQIRKAAQFINGKLLRYNKQYSDKDVQDFLAIAALQFAVTLAKMEAKSNLEEWTGKLNRMNGRLEEFLAPN